MSISIIFVYYYDYKIKLGIGKTLRYIIFSFYTELNFAHVMHSCSDL